ncbi:MAG: hypothetical protein JWM76_4204 [Pseudonocardiales bacterium]|nr:hypothetical protein [Pseudonocardiales bacterium]
MSTTAGVFKRRKMRSVSLGVMWDSNVKGNRETNGFHRRTEETNPGLVLGHLSFWLGYEVAE